MSTTGPRRETPSSAHTISSIVGGKAADEALGGQDELTKPGPHRRCGCRRSL